MLTGHCKIEFDKWYNKHYSFRKSFDSYPFAFSSGVLREFFVSIGFFIRMDISIAGYFFCEVISMSSPHHNYEANMILYSTARYASLEICFDETIDWLNMKFNANYAKYLNDTSQTLDK